MTNPNNDGKTRRVKWDAPHDLPDNPINTARIARIEKSGGFDPRSAGVPQVALNDLSAFPELPPDALVFVDGHHRRVMAVNAGRGNETHIMQIHEGMTREQIEVLFLKFNDYREHRANEMFVHRVRSNERKARKINELVEAAGFYVPAWLGVSTNAIVATGALEWVFDGAPKTKWSLLATPNGSVPKSYPAALTATLASAREMYGDDRLVTKGNLIKGLGAFYLRYGSAAINVERLHSTVPEKFPTVRKLFQAADGQREALNYQVPEAIGRVIRGAYNGQRGGKHALPEWSA